MTNATKATNHGETKMTQATVLNLDAITRIYSGPERGCRCGCLGSYAERGTRAFNLRLKKFEARLADAETTRDDGGNYIDLAKDGRSLCAYTD